MRKMIFSVAMNVSKNLLDRDEKEQCFINRKESLSKYSETGRHRAYLGNIT